MSTDPVAEARDLLATEHLRCEWEYDDYTGGVIERESLPGGRWIADACTDDIGQLIAAAPRLLAALADEVERLRSDRA